MHEEEGVCMHKSSKKTWDEDTTRHGWDYNIRNWHFNQLQIK